MSHRPRLGLLATLAAVLLAGCAGVRDTLDPEPPTVSVEGIRVTALGFNHAELELALRVANPNAVAVKLSGFDYRLMIDGRPVLEGERQRRLELPANDSATLEVPLRLNFGDVAGVIGSLAGRDRLDYRLELGLDVEVPVLGKRHITAEASDSLPVPQRPGLELRSLRVTKLDLTGASAQAVLAVSNPNGFALVLDRLDWDLAIDGTAVVSGGSTAPMRIEPHGEGLLTLQFDIGHEDIGRRLIDLLGGSGPVDYRLHALLAATAADERLGSFEVPLTQSGRVRLR